MGAVSLFASSAGGAIATFDPEKFKAAYPAFQGLTNEQLEEFFGIATIFLRNDGTGPVRVVATQQRLLNMLTAHLLQLALGPDGNGGNASMVGSINSASEGSVSVGLNFDGSQNAAWYNQTQYGATFWQATVAYRMLGRYRPGPTRFGTGIGVGLYPGGGYRS